MTRWVGLGWMPTIIRNRQYGNLHIALHSVSPPSCLVRLSIGANHGAVNWTDCVLDVANSALAPLTLMTSTRCP